MRQDACMTPDPTKAVQRRDDELKFLGVVVELGATMEQALHDAFCVLMESKFAAVVAAGQNMTWLIENCEALAKAHADLSEQHQRSIRDALAACRDANRRRNDLVHSVSFGDLAIKGKRGTFKITETPRTLDEIRAASSALTRAQSDLLAAIVIAFGDEALFLADQLRVEDIVAASRQSKEGR
jgi:hypothetical protein